MFQIHHPRADHTQLRLTLIYCLLVCACSKAGDKIEKMHRHGVVPCGGVEGGVLQPATYIKMFAGLIQFIYGDLYDTCIIVLRQIRICAQER